MIEVTAGTGTRPKNHKVVKGTIQYKGEEATHVQYLIQNRKWECKATYGKHGCTQGDLMTEDADSEEERDTQGDL